MSAVLVIGLALGLSLPLFGNYVIRAGIRFGGVNLFGDYAKGLVWACLIGLGIFLSPLRIGIKYQILTLWFVRCVVTLGFMLYYESFYVLDAQIYFRDAVRNDLQKLIHFGDGTAAVTMIAAVIKNCLPLADSYHALKVFWSFFGLIGVYFFYQTYVELTKSENYKVLWTLGLFPSILFWSSIFGKDPLVFLGLSLLTFGGCTMFFVNQARGAIFLFLGICLISIIRLWMGPIYIGPLIVSYVAFGKKRSVAKQVMILITSIAAVFLVQVYLQQLSIGASSDLLKKTDYLSKSWSRGGSGQEVPQFKSYGDLMSFAPQGIFTALFRPLPGEINNIFGILSGVENLILLLSMIWILVKLKLDDVRRPVLSFMFLTLLLWSLVYGFISYQNLGAAVRFKLQVLPLMLLMPFYLQFIRAKYVLRKT